MTAEQLQAQVEACDKEAEEALQKGQRLKDHFEKLQKDAEATA